jgi:tetratricopeptide (TPR) repeat protein
MKVNEAGAAMNRLMPLVLVLLVFLPLSARAADPADPSAVEAAAHFKKGTNAYRAGDLDEAITELKAAVKLKPTPNGMFALGQALREKGELAAAAHQYRQYLVLAPDGPFADKSKSFLASIEATLASARQTQAAAPQGVLPEPKPEPAPVLTAPPVITAPAPVVAVDVVAAKPPVYKRWWLWTTIGVVVVAGVAVGVVLGTESHTRSSDATVSF